MKNLLVNIICCVRKVLKDLKLLRKGQKSNYDLIQLSHRLEKGLLNSDPKPLWGWDKAYRIVELLKGQVDEFSLLTANAVLSAFLDAKSKSEFNEDIEKYESFITQTHYKTVVCEQHGGVRTVFKPVFTTNEQDVINRLFNSRYSCRSFDNRHVADEVVERAVQMAMRCPSACNRQPFRVYVIEPNKLAKQIGRDKLQYSGDRVLIITGDIRAFSSSEMLDWIVSPSIFVGYLTLAFHSLGVGSCVVRKDLVKPSAYNEAIRTLTEMDESEQIILELFIGYYKSEVQVPVSNRRNASQIIKFI